MITINDSVLRALGWALAHSLWQGAVAALVLLLLLPRLQTARQRYWAGYGALVGVLGAAGCTFLWKYEPVADRSTTSNLVIERSTDGSSFVDSHFFNTTISESFSRWLEANHALIVALWLIGFVFFLLRLGGGLWQVHRLRTRGLNNLEAIWQEKLLDLSHRIGVLQRVNLFESVWVHAPLTIGWLKPAILLPIGFVNRLSIAEVEAVLAHELAHIARRDWIFNLFQAFVESLFYYHPAVWWISQVIRRERENACDDTALAATGNPLAFARALVQVQELAAPSPTLALAMSGKRRRPLLERVRRILNQKPQQQHQVMEKITATVILLALLALLGFRANSVPSIQAAFAQIADIPASIFSGQSDENQATSDSLPKPKSTRKITREDENGRVEAEFKNGEITRLNIDGKEIPEAEFEDHVAIIEDLEEDVPPPPPPPAGFFGHGSDNGAHEFPEAPEAPDFFRFSPPLPALAPFPPMPPLRSGVSIETDKDKDGNTIIHLNNGGKGTEVIVKNGAVWIDGRKLETGEALDIPGLTFGQDGANFFYSDAEGAGYSFGDGNFAFGDGDAYARGISPEQREMMDAEMERVREDHSKLMEEHRRNYAQDKKRAKKDWKKNAKEWEKQQKEWEKDQQTWAREQKMWQEGQQKWQAEAQAMEAKNLAAQELLRSELLRDGLITDPEYFSMQLSAKVLKVNKKKQSEELRSKYESLIRKIMGQTLEGDDWNYNYNFNSRR